MNPNPTSSAEAYSPGTARTPPPVSVIIPCYNYGRFVGEAIDSVLTSEYPGGIEIIVVDDGSTDHTPDVLATYTGRIKVLRHNPNRGKAAATRAAIDAAEGDYLFNLDADDRFAPHKIRRVVETFQQYREVALVGQAWRFFGDDFPTPLFEPIPAKLCDRPLEGMPLLEHFYLQSNMFGAGSAYAAPMSVLRRIEIPDAVDVWVDEYLVLMTLLHGHGYLIGEPMFDYRIHGANVSADLRKAIVRADAANAIHERLEALPFSERLKRVYGIQTRVLNLYRQELLGQKSWSDVLALWRYVLTHRRLLDASLTTLAIRYGLLQRTAPTGIMRMLRRVAHRPHRQTT